MNIQIRQIGSSASEAAIRSHRVPIDRPTDKGGADEGPMGGELFLAGAEVRLLQPLAATTAPAPSAPATASESRAETRAREIVFIDSGIDGFRILAGDIETQRGEGRSVDVVVLDANRDGVAQIGEALAGRSGITAIHVLSHGDDGRLQLGNATLDATTLARYAPQIAAWRSALAGGADLLIYGCDVAAQADGRQLL